MPTRPSDLRERRRRIEEPPRAPKSPPPPTDHRVGTGLVPVIIRSTKDQILAGTIMVQRVAYLDSPPVVGSYRAVGEPFRAYPYWTSLYAHYQHYGHEGDPDDTETPFAIKDYAYLVMRDHGSPGAPWIMIMPVKGGAAVLDPNAQQSGCNFA